MSIEGRVVALKLVGNAFFHLIAKLPRVSHCGRNEEGGGVMHSQKS